MGESPARERMANLTPRETDVFGCVIDGLSNQEIADKLSISVKTVEHHLGSIYRKHRVHSRGQLLAAVIHGGLWARHRGARSGEGG